MSTPLSSTGTEDKLVWLHTKSSHFNVKSVYHLKRSILTRAKGESSSTNSHHNLWRNIWNLKASNAVKMFILWAYREVLSTYQSLYKRRVISKPLCSFCFRYPEAACHVLWECEVACDVWCKWCIKLQKMSFTSTYFKYVWHLLYPKLEATELAMFAFTAKTHLAEEEWEVTPKKLYSS